jgi:bacteriophage N4 adsorption protein B
LIQKFPRAIALHYAVLPLRELGDVLVLGSESYVDPVSLAAMGRKLSRTVQYVIAPKGQIAAGLRRWYAGEEMLAERNLLHSLVLQGRITLSNASAVWEDFISRRLFIGDIFQALGRIDTAALSALLLRRESSQMLLGEYLVDQQVLTPPALDEALQLQAQLQVSITTLLQRAGVLPREETGLKRA